MRSTPDPISQIRPPRGSAISCHIMPVIEPASRYSELRRQEAVSPKLLFAIDAISAPGSPVHDLDSLTSAAVAAIDAGSGHVLDSTHVVFPNGAITVVLILAESHLSIHTWPEENMVAIDLFSCGAIDGPLVVDRLVRELRLESVTIRQIPRGATRS
jgi:S-adenosylmethionine decarboxylase